MRSRLVSVVAAGLLGVTLGKAPPFFPGKGFDRFITIWLENRDYAKVVEDSHFLDLKREGILLTRYYAHTHPSQPNYIAAISGDYFGLDHDDIVRIPANVSTIIDLFDWKGLSWKGYFEDLPGPGYMAGFSDGQTGGGTWDYVRKHNPFVSFDSIAINGSRLWNIVGFDEFRRDVAARQVPQYAFMTPNMMNDGHNTTLEYATSWAHHFLQPLLEDERSFGNGRTLILLTYDESETYQEPNHIASLLLGTAVPPHLKGTTDNTFYTHYSMLSTIEYNWGLPNLGRYDVGANVFQFVLDEAGKVDGLPVNKDPPDVEHVDNSISYPGYLHNDTAMRKPIPPPNLGLKGASGLGILDDIRSLWVTHYGEHTPYDGSGRVYDAVHEPQYKAQTEQHVKDVRPGGKLRFRNA